RTHRPRRPVLRRGQQLRVRRATRDVGGGDQGAGRGGRDMRGRRSTLMALLAALLLAGSLEARAFDLVRSDEATIADIHAALTLKGVMSKTDAFQIKKLRAAGAVMLAKSNMAEFAFDPMETVNSLLPGYTRNPYALDRVTAGSSGGTAAAVAASLGAVGLGTDTGNSIRGPSSH